MPSDSLIQIAAEVGDLIDKWFNTGEIEALCQDMGFKSGNIPGATDHAKARNLADECRRNNSLLKLIELCCDKRPAIRDQWDKLSQKINGLGPSGSAPVVIPPPLTVIYKPIVPRMKDLNLVRDEIGVRCRQRANSRNVIQFFGTEGIGKTTFLVKSIIPLLSTDYPGELPWVSLDFDRDVVNDRYDGKPGRGRIIIDIVQGLFKSIGEEPPGGFIRAQRTWEENVNRWGDSSESSEDLRSSEEKLFNQFKMEIVPSLIERPGGFPMVIMLDTVEEIDSEKLKWIQNSLQYDTIATGRVLWVMAGRYQVKSDHYYLRRQYHHQKLDPFEVQEIRHQIRWFESQADLAPVLCRFSHGLPAVANKMAEEIQQLDDRTHSALSINSFDNDDAWQELVPRAKRYIEDNKKILGQQDDQLLTAIKMLSAFRMFNLSILLRFSERFAFNGWRIGLFVNPDTLHEQLTATKLVDWNKEQRAYAVEEPLRQILSDILCHENKSLFLQINELAFDIFSSWINVQDGRWRDYLIEAAYHKAVLATLRDSDHNFSELRTLVKDSIANRQSDDAQKQSENRNELRERLEHDQDFQALLSAGQFDELMNIVESSGKQINVEANG